MNVLYSSVPVHTAQLGVGCADGFFIHPSRRSFSHILTRCIRNYPLSYKRRRKELSVSFAGYVYSTLQYSKASFLTLLPVGVRSSGRRGEGGQMQMSLGNEDETREIL